MNEIQIMLAVANDPRVRAYREAVQVLHRRMTSTYGKDYAQAAEAPVEGKRYESPFGVTRMTPLDADRFASLMRGAAKVRADVRAEILASR